MKGYFIDELEISNFKSIKEITLEPTRVNLFIGEPNTGKSNLLESLGLASLVARRNSQVKDFARYEYLSNLFYDDLLNVSVEIKFNGNFVKVSYQNGQYVFDGYHKEGNKSNSFMRMNTDGGATKSEFAELEMICNHFRFYRFDQPGDQESNMEDNNQILEPPYGSNLFSVVYHNPEYRKLVSNLIKEFGYTLHLRPHERQIEVQKSLDETIVSFPYTLLSDTLKNIIFHMIAIESNENSVLIFEEPESHTFPYYTKLLGEKIAVDTNQYFIVTHNPYFLTGVVEKVKNEEISIFVTYTENYETKVKNLTIGQIEELLDYDPFLNLNKFYEV